MNSSIRDLRLAVFTSSLLVAPFAILESFHTTLTKQNASGIFLLFGLLWLLPAVFLLLMLPAVRSLMGKHDRAASFGLLVRITLGVLVVMAWGGLVLDQLPCFLGIPNCD